MGFVGGGEEGRECEGEGEEGDEGEEVAREEEAERGEAGEARGGAGGFGARGPVGGELGIGAVEGAVGFEPELLPGGIGDGGGGRGGVGDAKEDGGVVLPLEEKLRAWS